MGCGTSGPVNETANESKTSPRKNERTEVTRSRSSLHVSEKSFEQREKPSPVIEKSATETESGKPVAAVKPIENSDLQNEEKDEEIIKQKEENDKAPQNENVQNHNVQFTGDDQEVSNADQEKELSIKSTEGGESLYDSSDNKSLTEEHKLVLQASSNYVSEVMNQAEQNVRQLEEDNYSMSDFDEGSVKNKDVQSTAQASVVTAGAVSLHENSKESDTHSLRQSTPGSHMSREKSKDSLKLETQTSFESGEKSEESIKNMSRETLKESDTHSSRQSTPGSHMSREKSKDSLRLETQTSFVSREKSKESLKSMSRETTPTNRSENQEVVAVVHDTDNGAGENVCDDTTKLPQVPQRDRPANFPSLNVKSNAKWPIRSFAKFDCTVNGGYGGCAGLLLGSNCYNSPGKCSTSNITLLRFGFDCNHFSTSSIVGSYGEHFHPEYYWCTDEDGVFLGNLMFGTNNVMLITNDSKNGRLGNGRYAEETGDKTNLYMNVDAGESGGAGTAFVLCSGMESDSKPVSGAYLIAAGGKKDNYMASKLIKGEDKWKFEVSEDGYLQASGPSNSRYSVYYNREELVMMEENMKQSNVLMTQALNGEDPTVMVESIPAHGCYWVLCSNSSGEDDRTAAALYMLSIDADKSCSKHLISSSHGEGYTSGDLWNFEKTENSIVAKGAKGPCRYAVLSNEEYKNQHYIFQDICLATGSPQPIRGRVEIDEGGVQGIVEKPSKISIQVDHRIVRTFQPEELKKVHDGWGFKRVWQSGEMSVGAHMIRVFIVKKHVVSEVERSIQMTGSPKQLIIQKDKVYYALNCGGAAYTAQNDITFTSEHRQFSSFTYDFCWGGQCLAYGKPYHLVRNLQLINNTHDGFLYTSVRTKHTEPVDEQKVIYTVKTIDVPDGKYILRYHTVGKTGGAQIKFNGKSILPQIAAASDKVQDVGNQGLTGYHADVPVDIEGNQFVLYTDKPISGFAVLDPTYKDPTLSEDEIKVENEEKNKLTDQIEPLTRSLLRKEMEIVGWSPNLLENASAENGDMSHWNTSGDWKVHEGGYGTEKAFVTSHMWCTKYQEVDLTQHFATEYLDTAPDIQVTEWYREGVCGGGHYGMEIHLMDNEGNKLKSHVVPKTGRIYRNNKWEQTGTTFSNYGPGVRIVSISSSGKDDKYWGGHYGPIISTSVVRVKRESTPAPDDKFADLDMDSSDNSKWTGIIDKLVTRVLTENKEMLDQLLQDQAVPKFDDKFEKQTEIKTVITQKAPVKRKKREIRVFVSSTFKDFSQEREEIIKKTFREINRLCSSRGIFFTYVDLRWGISTEQSTDGKTIAICLKEIERCRPYFLCLLGDRFGWSQREENPDELLNKTYDYAIENHQSLEWIKEYRYDTSVTQLEVLHGVLNNVELNRNRSFFYLRKPKEVQGMTEKEMKVFLSESEWHKERQEKLKNIVREAGKDVQSLNLRSFITPTDVSLQIKEDLQWCIEEDFPLGSELSPLEREREAHQAFADIRCLVYIGREDYFTQITDKLQADISQPMVLLGESGCGKSALVANWVKRTKEAFPQAFVFVHFIGSSAESASYLKLLRRLYEEMKQFFGLDLTVPSSDTLLIRDLSKWLKIAGSRTKCVIVLDALNQLDDGSKEDGVEHDLLWIPGDLPPNVFLLLSTLPGRAMEAVKKFEWPTMKVSPLENSQKMEIIEGYLEGIYGKTLSLEQKQMIVDAKQTDNPLYLRSILDEVRVYGHFRTLTKKIEEYLTAENPGDLFAKILERMEDDFKDEENMHGVLQRLKESSRLNMVKEATTAIWCSNRGMSEGELVELLDVPSVVWSPFYMSLSENLVNRNGILNFFHDHLRQAVEKKYLNTPELKKECYLKLANYFSEKELEDRVVDELPFLLARAGELERLKETISSFQVFQRLIKDEDGKFELIKSWQLLGDYSLVKEEYLKKLAEIPEEDRKKESYAKLLDDLGSFFVDLGLYGAAREVYEKLVNDLEKKYHESHGALIYSAYNHSWKYRSKHPDVVKALKQLGLICEKQMELDASLYYYNDAVSRQTKVVTPTQKIQLCEGLLGLASVMNLKDSMHESRKFLIRALELATDVLGRQHHFVAAILNKLGILGYTQSRVDEALGYFLQDLKLTRSEVGVSHPRIARILGAIGLVYDDKNDKLAGELYEGSLAMLLDTYGSTHVDVAKMRYNLGTFYFATNYFAKARYQFQEALEIFQAFLSDDHPDVKLTKKALEDLP